MQRQTSSNICLSSWETCSSEKHANSKKMISHKCQTCVHNTCFNCWLCICWQTFTFLPSSSYFFFMHARCTRCKYSSAYTVRNLPCALRMLWRERYFAPPILTVERLSFYRLKRARENAFGLKMRDDNKSKIINKIIHVLNVSLYCCQKFTFNLKENFRDINNFILSI